MAFVDSCVLRIQSSKYMSGHGTPRVDYLKLHAKIYARRRISKLILAASMRSLADEKEIHSTTGGKYHVAWQSVKEERWQGGLKIDGKIPHWLNGTYLRNGSGVFDIGDYSVDNFLDGYVTLVRVEFDDGKLIGGHAQLLSDAFKAAKRNNRSCHRGFSEIPMRSIFFSSIVYLLGMVSGASITDNANISVVRLGDGRVICLTETTKGSIEIDPKTLETIGRFNYTDSVGGMNQNQVSHPMISEKELITILPGLINPGYHVVRMLAGTNERALIGRLNCRGGHAPGWVHSFAATDNYIIIPDLPLRYSLDCIFGGNIYKWQPETKVFMHVVSRQTGRTVTSVEVPMFMAVHYINAKKSSIIVDCCEYNADPSIMDRWKLQELRSFSSEDVLLNSRIGRFTIPLDGSPTGELDVVIAPDKHGRLIDFCTINPKNIGKKYRYMYGCSIRRPCNVINSLINIDLEKQETKSWYVEGGIPSEPLFVARPGAKTEDDGVIISLVSDKHGGGFALILDGTTFLEVARAKFPYGLPFDTHGCWLPKYNL